MKEVMHYALFSLTASATALLTMRDRAMNHPSLDVSSHPPANRPFRLTGIAQRICRLEDVIAQVNSHSVIESYSIFTTRVLDIIFNAMTDYEKLSLEVLDNETKSRAFALVILKMLTAAGGLGQGNGGAAA